MVKKQILIWILFENWVLEKLLTTLTWCQLSHWPRGRHNVKFVVLCKYFRLLSNLKVIIRQKLDTVIDCVYSLNSRHFNIWLSKDKIACLCSRWKTLIFAIKYCIFAKTKIVKTVKPVHRGAHIDVFKQKNRVKHLATLRQNYKQSFIIFSLKISSPPLI